MIMWWFRLLALFFLYPSIPMCLFLFVLLSVKFLAENPSTKRRSLTSPDGKPSKKLKTAEALGEDEGGEKEEKKKTKKKKDALDAPLSPSIWGHMQVG